MCSRKIVHWHWTYSPINELNTCQLLKINIHKCFFLPFYSRNSFYPIKGKQHFFIYPIKSNFDKWWTKNNPKMNGTSFLGKYRHNSVCTIWNKNVFISKLRFRSKQLRRFCHIRSFICHFVGDFMIALFLLLFADTDAWKRSSGTLKNCMSW